MEFHEYESPDPSGDTGPADSDAASEDVDDGPGRALYATPDLQGHGVSAECNPGGGTTCDCSDVDVQVISRAGYGEVVSNPNQRNTWVNAIGHKKFIERFPDGSPVTLGTYRYTGEFRLPVLPLASVESPENPQAAHMMVQLWDGREALYGSGRHTLEGVLYWALNPYTPEYGGIHIYTDPQSLVPTDLILEPDTEWHRFELVVDLERQEYVSLAVDGRPASVAGQRLTRVAQPTWGEEVVLIITTESLSMWPQASCGYAFSWTMQYRDLELRAVDPS